MCSFHTLFHDNKSGYVIRCKGCKNIQVTFGNFIVTFNKADFNQFITVVKTLRAQQQQLADIAVKSLIIPTPCEGVRLLLSYRELQELDSMLDAADTELQSLEFIALFKENEIL